MFINTILFVLRYIDHIIQRSIEIIESTRTQLGEYDEIRKKSGECRCILPDNIKGYYLPIVSHPNESYYFKNNKYEEQDVTYHFDVIGDYEGYYIEVDDQNHHLKHFKCYATQYEFQRHFFELP